MSSGVRSYRPDRATARVALATGDGVATTRGDGDARDRDVAVEALVRDREHRAANTSPERTAAAPSRLGGTWPIQSPPATTARALLASTRAYHTSPRRATPQASCCMPSAPPMPLA